MTFGNGFKGQVKLILSHKETIPCVIYFNIFYIFSSVPIVKNIAKTESSPSEASQHSMQSPQKTTLILPTQQVRRSGRIKPPGPTTVPKRSSSVKNISPRRKGPNSGKKVSCISS